MKGRRWALLICGVLLCANLAFIWGNSALTGQASMEVSGEAMSLLGRLAQLLGPKGETILRKIAHFAEFASLGLLLGCFFRLLGRNGWLGPLLAGLLAACVDETIQIFAPGRASSLLDVWLDLVGVLTGIIAAFLGQILGKRLLIHFGGNK